LCYQSHRVVIYNPTELPYCVILFKVNVKGKQLIYNLYVINDYRDRSPGAVTNIIDTLQWDSLACRRTKASLILLYKINWGLVEVPTMLSQSDRRNRGAHKFSQIKLFFFKFSFFTNTISVWNRLPQSIALSPNIESFKNGICTLTFEGFPTHLYDTYCKPLYIIHVIFVCLFFVLFIIVFNCPCTYRTQFRDVTHSILIV
jgi:hypothetical protein